MYIYIYMYICIYTYIYINMYAHRYIPQAPHPKQVRCACWCSAQRPWCSSRSSRPRRPGCAWRGAVPCTPTLHPNPTPYSTP